LLGAKTALAIYNASNPSIQVNLVQVDDQGDPAVAGTVAPGVAQNKNIIGVVGGAYSGATIASIPSYRAVSLAMVSPSATRVTLTDKKSPDNGYPVFHRVVATDALQGPALVRWAIKDVSSPKVYVIDDQSSYGVGLKDLVNAYIKKQGVKKVGADSVPQKTSDYSATTAKVISAGANVVIYTGYYSDAASLAKSLRDNGYKGVIAGGDGVLDSAFIPLAGSAAAGVKMTAGALPFELAANDAQKAAFTKATGLSSAAGHAYVTEAFNATNVFLSIISKGGALTRGSVLHQVATGSFAGLGGTTISFTPLGEIKGGAPISGFTVENGVIKYYGAQ
jgi:branched-chain amino acid transport system substrate-binding protein